MVILIEGSGSMDKLLIAVQSGIFAQFLAKEFGAEYDVRTCCDGCDALDLLASFTPDAMILSLCLPRKDALTILEQSSHIPKIILGISDHSDPYGFSAAQRLGVSRILVSPTINAVVVALCQMRLHQNEPAQKDPNEQAAFLLHSLGFSPNLEGFPILCAGIPLLAADPSRRLSGDIYSELASQLNCSESSIEASIRRAIKKAWLKHDSTVWAKFFAADPSGNIPCPNNSLFLKRLAQEIGL